MICYVVPQLPGWRGEQWHDITTAGELGPMIGFLLSYWYCKETDLDALIGALDPKPPLFADSGAYSAHSAGTEISVSDYAAWIKRWEHLFPHYSNLDVIGDPKASQKNQRSLERKGLSPIPVFHVGSDFKILTALAKEYDYAALGGMVSVKRKGPHLVGWLDRCFDLAEETKLHGFGMTNWPLVERVPWHSVDSSSIAKATATVRSSRGTRTRNGGGAGTLTTPLPGVVSDGSFASTT